MLGWLVFGPQWLNPHSEEKKTQKTRTKPRQTELGSKWKQLNKRIKAGLALRLAALRSRCFPESASLHWVCPVVGENPLFMVVVGKLFNFKCSLPLQGQPSLGEKGTCIIGKSSRLLGLGPKAAVSFCDGREHSLGLFWQLSRMFERAKAALSSNFHLLNTVLLLPPVGFEGNLSLLDLFFPRGLKQMEGKESWFVPGGVFFASSLGFQLAFFVRTPRSPRRPSRKAGLLVGPFVFLARGFCPRRFLGAFDLVVRFLWFCFFRFLVSSFALSLSARFSLLPRHLVLETTSFVFLFFSRRRWDPRATAARNPNPPPAKKLGERGTGGPRQFPD